MKNKFLMSVASLLFMTATYGSDVAVAENENSSRQANISKILMKSSQFQKNTNEEDDEEQDLQKTEANIKFKNGDEKDLKEEENQKKEQEPKSKDKEKEDEVEEEDSKMKHPKGWKNPHWDIAILIICLGLYGIRKLVKKIKM